MEARIDTAPQPFDGHVPATFASAAAAKLWLSERFAQERDPHRLLAVALEAMGRFLRVSRIAYGELDAALEWMTVPLDWTDGSVASRSGPRRFERESSFARHYRSGRTLLIADTAAAALDAEQRDSLAASGIRSVLGVPLIEDGQLVAVFNATHTEPRAWTDDEVVLFAQTGARIWGALEHLRMLEKLREGEEQFRTLAETMPGLCWLGDARGKPYWGNARAAAFFSGSGRGRGDMAWVLHPDDHARVASAWAEARRTGTALELTARVRGSDGAYRPFLASGTPIRDAGGQVVRWCGVLVDLSAQDAHERNQAFLAGWNDRLRGELSPQALVDVTLESLARHLEVGRATYAEGDSEGRFSILGEWRDGAVPSLAQTRFSLGEVGEAVAREWAAGGVVRYDDVAADARIEDAVRPAYAAAGIGAFVSIPLLEHGRVRSALSVQHPEARRWRADEVQLLRDVAERLWVMLERARAQAELLERERHQAFLISWSDAIRGLAEPQAIVDTTLWWLGRHLKVTRVTYARCDAGGRRFTVTGEWREGVRSILGNSFLLESVGAAVDRAWTQGEVIRYDDVAADPRLEPAAAERYRATEIGAFLSLPLVEDGRMHAALSLQHRAPRAWTAREIDLIRDIAERTWVALERAQAQEALAIRQRNQAFLLAWSDRVAQRSDAQAILADTVAALGRHLGVERANFADTAEDGQSLHVRHEWVNGVGSLVDQRYPVAALGERLAAAHFSGAPVRIDDIATDPRMDEGNRPLFEALGIAAVVTLPMVRSGKVVAALSLQQGSPRHWTDAEVELIGEVAARTLAVLERARSEERLAASEAQLSAFMENAPVAMHLKDARGRYVRVNPEFARALGRQRDDFGGMHPDDLFPPDVASEIEQLERVARAGEVARAEITLDGAHVLAMAFPVPGGTGGTRTGGFTLDITERRRAEAALARSREMLYQTEKLSALGSLLAGVSHELNNPLSIVVAQSVMMERQAGGGVLADRAQKIRKAADRCARIVQTFLAMARQRRPERTATDLNAIVTAAHELAAYGLRSDGIATRHDLAAGLPLIAADADQLHQIVLNLLVNAQHAMAGVEGDRVLTLRTAAGPEPGTVVLEVADTGPGVPDHVRRRIFEPFFTTKPQGQGTGVGLSFSQGLAEAHGGRLELVPTATGAGACFRLTLPVEPGMPAPVGTDPPEQAPAPLRRALVVDDEREIAEALADFLSVEGFACDIAEGGAAAKAQLAHAGYDLIVSDLRMPGVDGPELYGWLLGERPELARRMGFATGDTLGAGAARFLAEAKRPVLEKPFMPDAVHRFLQQMDLP